MSKRVVRVVWGRLRTDWAFLLACWLLVATATTLVTAGALYADTVELGGVRRALAEADPADQGVLVRLPSKADQVGDLDGKVRPVLQNSFDEAGADVFLTARSASLQPADGGQPGIDPAKPVGQQLIVLGSYEDIDQHASIVDGRWPDAGKSPMEAAISEKAAAALGLSMGSRVQLADAATPLADPGKVTADVQIVGIWRPNQRGDAYWLGDSLDLDGVAVSSTTTRGPLIVAQKDLLDSATQAGVELRWRALPHVTDITLTRIADLRAAVGGIAGALAGVLPANPKPVLNTNLANVLGTIDQSVAVSRAGVVLVILQFVLLAGYAVLLAGALLVERRRPEVALFRARGARGSQVGALAIAESLAIAVPAAIVAPFVALLVVNFIGNLGAVGEAGIISAPSLSAAVLLVTLLATLACVAVMSFPALVSDVDLAHVRASIGRPLGRTMAQRIGLDIVLLAVTAIGLYQLQSYGTPLTHDATGDITLDPVLVAAPALALAAGALLVIRLVPRIGEIADRLFDRQRGLTLPLASNEIARRPLRYTRTALLIVLATALATFAATYTSTWADSQAAQASYQTAADIRLSVNPQSDLSKSQGAGTLKSIDGVSDLMPLTRDTVTTSRRTGSIDILMLDARKAAAEVGLSAEAQQRDGKTGLTGIASDLQFAGLTLPPGSKRLGVVFDISLKPNDSRFPIDSLTAAAGQGVGVRAQVSVGGTATYVNGLANTFNGTGQRVALDLPAEALTDPDNPDLLLGMWVTPLAPINMGGDVTAVRFEVSPSDSGDGDWTTVAQTADLTSWGFEGGGNSLHFDDNNPVRPSDTSGFGEPPQQYPFTPASVADPIVPVIASDGFLLPPAPRLVTTFSSRTTRVPFRPKSLARCRTSRHLTPPNRS